MPTVELTDDPKVSASCRPLQIKQQEVTRVYFATKEVTEKLELDPDGDTEIVIDHITRSAQTLPIIAKEHGVDESKLERTKSGPWLYVGEVIKVTKKAKKTKTVKFKEISKGSMNAEVYLIAETKNLQNEKVLFNILQGEEDCLAKKDKHVTVQQDESDVTLIKATIGEYCEDDDISNKDDFADWGIAKLILAPKDENKLTEWTDGLDCVASKKSRLYVLADVHSEHSYCDFKSQYVHYKGYKGGEDNSKVPNHFLNEEDTWFELQNAGICGGAGCVKEGDENKLVQEINIRLAGFGGNVPTKKFTSRTVDMIKQFQKDYMEIDPTGKVCGETLEAIDEFESKYPIKFSELKCDCGVCSGFGQGKYVEQKQKSNVAEKYRKYEYPGIHRSLLWAYKAMMFYMAKKEGGKYSINKISSGYRCHEDNKQHGRSSTNHMGKAIDIHFNKDGKRTRDILDVEKVRDNIIIPTNKAQINWGSKNKFSLEPSRNASFVATTWIHMDVRQFELEYLKDEFFANTEAKIKGKKIVEVAKDEGFEHAIDCLGGGVGFTSQDGSESSAVDSDHEYKWSHSKFGNLIAKKESNGDYNICNKTKPKLAVVRNVKVVETKIKDIQAKQKAREIFAVGRYQLIPTTLNEAVSKLGLDVNEKLDEDMQDRIFDEYLIDKKRPQIIAYLEGKGSINDAMYAAAKEWASIGVEKGKKISKGRTAKGGESYYAGDGLNKAHITPEEIKTALSLSKNENQ